MSNCDDRNDAGNAADVTMPRGEPFEDLKCGTVGELLETPPLGFNGFQTLVNLEFDFGQHVPGAFRGQIGGRRTIAYGHHAGGPIGN